MKQWAALKIRSKVLGDSAQMCESHQSFFLEFSRAVNNCAKHKFPKNGRAENSERSFPLATKKSVVFKTRLVYMIKSKVK